MMLKSIINLKQKKKLKVRKKLRKRLRLRNYQQKDQRELRKMYN